MFGLPIWAIKWIAYAVIGATLLGLVAYVKVEWDTGQRAKAKIHAAATAQARVAAAVHRVDTAAAPKEKAAQAALQAHTRIIIERIPVYVPKPVPGAPCIPWSVIKLHDAAVLGLKPEDLSPPAYGPDAACSPVSPSDLATVIARNYGAAQANAEQLNALEANIKARNSAAVASGASPNP